MNPKGPCDIYIYIYILNTITPATINPSAVGLSLKILRVDAKKPDPPSGLKAKGSGFRV